MSCKTCNAPPASPGADQCTGCHEVELRLSDYLLVGGEKARTFVLKSLDVMENAEIERLRNRVDQLEAK